MLTQSAYAATERRKFIMVYHNFDSMPLVLSVEDVADTLAIGRNKAYGLVNSGTLKALKIGQHYRVPREEFIDFIKKGAQSA